MTNFPDLKDLIQGIDTSLDTVSESDENNAFGSAAPEPMAKYILVTIGSRRLAIAIDSLAEVGSIPQITFLPNLPGWIKGIMNIRSEIISMIDFTGFLEEEPKKIRGEKKLVVLRNEKMKVGTSVDNIVGTVTKYLSDIAPSDLRSESVIGQALFAQQLAVDGESYAILNVDTFLSHSKLVNFSEMS